MKQERHSTIFVLLLTIGIFGGACSLEIPAENLTTTTALAAEERDPDVRKALDFIKVAPESLTAHHNLAIVYIRKARRTGDPAFYAKAEEAASGALAIDPADASSRKLLGATYVANHKFTEALEIGRQLEKEFPADALVQGLLTDAHIELGDYDAAVKSAQRMMNSRPDSLSYARAAHLRSLHGNHAGAVETYKLAARTADPGDPEAQAWCLVMLGDEYYENGKYEQAVKVYDEALTLLPDYHMAVASKGRAQTALGKLADALQTLTPLYARIPTADTAALIGSIYQTRGDTAQAKTYYDQVESLETKAGGDQERLAMLWADTDTRVAEALAIAERQNKGSQNILTADLYAWCLYKNGRLEEARAAVQKAMRLKTNDAHILYHAGMIENGLGNRKEARRLLEAAIKLSPVFDLVQIEKAKETLRQLKGRD